MASFQKHLSIFKIYKTFQTKVTKTAFQMWSHHWYTFQNKYQNTSQKTEHNTQNTLKKKKTLFNKVPTPFSRLKADLVIYKKKKN